MHFYIANTELTDSKPFLLVDLFLVVFMVNLKLPFIEKERQNILCYNNLKLKNYTVLNLHWWKAAFHVNLSKNVTFWKWIKVPKWESA